MAKKIYKKMRSLVFTFTKKSRIQSRKLAIENPSIADPTTMALWPGHSTSGAEGAAKNALFSRRN